jgi:hypothetical protein
MSRLDDELRMALRREEPGEDFTKRVLERAAALGGEVLEFRVHQPDLQDVFIRMTGRELRD